MGRKPEETTEVDVRIDLRQPIRGGSYVLSQSFRLPGDLSFFEVTRLLGRFHELLLDIEAEREARS